MDLLAQVTEGFKTIEFDEANKQQGLRFIKTWIEHGDYVGYRPQLEWLIQQKQWAGLLDRFYQILPFGTGGRRGAVGIGPNRMNLWTLGASVQGHCEYLRQRFPGVEPLRVVLAYDVRQFEDKRKNYNADLPNPVLHLSSRLFAEYAVGVYVANGIHAHILPSDSTRYLATPELSYSIRFLKAHGGLNISASHNPPDDNGGKFYDERGGQPVPPDDQIMADLVDQVTHIKHLGWHEAVRTSRVHFLSEEPHRAYIEMLRREALLPAPKFDEMTVVYTPLHGVGSNTAMKLLEAQGFRVAPVESQMKPDGQFTNVTQSPNPEVPASMDKAEAQARAIGADLILSTDPDADRLGAMVPTPAGKDKPWRFITGHEIATLLTHFKLSKLVQQNRLPRSPVVVRTDVTTSMITRIARHFGVQIVDNLLVGFKYIADVIWQLEQSGKYEDVQGAPEDFVIGGEESHGILVTPHIRDKDAAGGALLMAELVLDRLREGKSVFDYLNDLYRQFGYFRNEVIPVSMPGIHGKQQMATMLNTMRKSPPKQFAGLAVTGIEDLRDQNGRMGPFKGATDEASRNVLIYRLGDKGRVVLRPSGTEPKAKAYVEVCSPPCAAGTKPESWQATCKEIDDLTRRLAEDFLRTALGTVGEPMPEGGIKLAR